MVNTKKMFVLYDMNQYGRSLGCHCEDCLVKGYSNARILNQKIKEEEIFQDRYPHSCVFCGYEVPMLPEFQKIKDEMKPLEELKDSIHESFKRGEICKEIYVERLHEVYDKLIVLEKQYNA